MNNNIGVSDKFIETMQTTRLFANISLKGLEQLSYKLIRGHIYACLKFRDKRKAIKL
jgi:hypothetical protein